MASSPDRDGVKLDGQGRVGDGWYSRHDGLGHVFALEGRGEVAASYGS